MDISLFGVGALVILLIGIAIGYKRGFIKEAISACFVLLSFVLVWYLNPYVNEFVREKTPVYETINEHCMEMLTEKVGKLNGNLEEAEDALIDSMNLPAFIKQQIKDRDQEKGILNLDAAIVSVSSSLTEMLVNGISFLITYLSVVIALKVLTSLLNMLSELPGIKTINRTAGAVVGGVKGLLLIWIVLMFITLLCNTEIGQKCLELMENDSMIKVLNSMNPFMKIFMNING